MMPASMRGRPLPAVFREGNKVYVRRRTPGATAGAELPALCVKCGAPSAGTLRRKFLWHEPWLYVLILAGVVIYAIVALIVRKRLDVAIPLCAEHRARRRRAVLVAWGLVVAGIAAPFVLQAPSLGAIGVVILFLALVVAAVIAAVIWSPIRPTLIEDGGGSFKGCGEEFLRQLR